jgi:predicted RNA-binding protein (virulence factor B family)
MDVGSQIEAKFPNYRDTLKAVDWNNVCKELALGSLVSGQIVLKFDFGYVIDTGLSFPALMLLGNFKPENSNLSVGSNISGNIYVFDDTKNQIGVTQTGRKDWMAGSW